MRFHVTTEVRDTIVLDDDKRMREMLGSHFVIQDDSIANLRSDVEPHNCFLLSLRSPPERLPPL